MMVKAVMMEARQKQAQEETVGQEAKKCMS